MQHFNLIRIGCITTGLAFTRLSSAVPPFLGIILALISMALFIYPIGYELYTHYMFTETVDPLEDVERKTNRRKTVYQYLIQLPLLCITYFVMLLGVKWLQGEAPLLKNMYEKTATLNMATILTFFSYIYLAHIEPRIHLFTRTKEQGAPKDSANTQKDIDAK